MSDAAKSGNWQAVIRVVDTDQRLDVNQWRIGGRSWFTPLHQAAWHGADVSVVTDLLDRGAWRSLRDANGRQPIDLAQDRGHSHLALLLQPDPISEAQRTMHGVWDDYLKHLVESRVQNLPPLQLRHVNTEVVAQERLRPLWFAIPGMYGGFSIEIFNGRLCVESWSRVVGGSGQAHVITDKGCVLVEEGFV
ncbi:hypothetical protein [Nocardioides salsibiostraticola]